MGEFFIKITYPYISKHNHNVARDTKKGNELYSKIVDETKQRSSLSQFHVSQAVFTPTFGIMSTETLFMGRPSLYQWTRRQYVQNGPFDKWLRSVKTCRTTADCCGPSGFSNIIIRDFPTRAFTSNVIAKNYQVSLTAFGSEGQCHRSLKQKIAEAARKAKELAEKIKAQEAAIKAEKERKAREEAKIKAQEEEKRQKEADSKAKETTSFMSAIKNAAAKAAAAAKNAAELAAQKAAAQKAAAAAVKAVSNLFG